jgi:hypothetical protein
MSEDRDDRLVEFLCAGAPPPHDPVFRLRVLEQREHRQFRHRLYTILAGVLVILLVSAFAIRIGGGALEITGALVVGVAFASAYLAFRGRLLQILRRFSI